MRKLLLVSLMLCAVGCGESSSIPPAAEPMVAPAVMPPPDMVPTQKFITDENGTVRTITVPVPVIQSGEPIKVWPKGENAPRPKAKMESLTVESVRAEFDQVVSEMKEVVARETSEKRLKEIYLPLFERLKSVQERSEKPDFDLVREQAEIRAIGEALRRQTPRPRRTLPAPKEGKEAS